jgi:hypothetical protein
MTRGRRSATTLREALQRVSDLPEVIDLGLDLIDLFRNFVLDL